MTILFTISVARLETFFIAETHAIMSLTLSSSVIPSFLAIKQQGRRTFCSPEHLSHVHVHSAYTAFSERYKNLCGVL